MLMLTVIHNKDSSNSNNKYGKLCYKFIILTKHDNFFLKKKQYSKYVYNRDSLQLTYQRNS